MYAIVDSTGNIVSYNGRRYYSTESKAKAVYNNVFFMRYTWKVIRIH